MSSNHSNSNFSPSKYDQSGYFTGNATESSSSAAYYNVDYSYPTSTISQSPTYYSNANPAVPNTGYEGYDYSSYSSAGYYYQYPTASRSSSSTVTTTPPVVEAPPTLTNTTIQQPTVSLKATPSQSSSSIKDTSSSSISMAETNKQTTGTSKKKQKTIIRAAGGEVWEDPTLLEWDINLGNEVTDDLLYKAFSKYPSLQKAKVVRDKRTGKSKGYGFVSFKDADEFVKAWKEMNGKYVGNRPIKLRKSTWKDRNIEVVLAAAICTKGGKVVLSRQFREMPRPHIEGLLASFPKLTSAGQQHTTIEIEHVRYVYQPLDELYIVLITNRQSNILQDIDTLHLFARVVSDVCRSTDEREILKNSFELLSAFDEIVSLGYRENVNLAQVKSIIEMESHEEKIQEILARNKEQEAKEELKRRAKQLELQKKEMLKRGGNTSFGSNFSQSINRLSSYSEPQVQSPFDDGIRSSYNSSPSASVSSKAKGMQLGRKQKTVDLFEAVKVETGFEEITEKTNVRSSTTAVSKVPTESVHISISEKISLVANRDGGLENLEVKGDVKLTISDPNLTRIKLAVEAVDDGNVQLQTHPNVDKKLFTSDGIIALKNPAKGFPVNQPLGVLRWRFITKDATNVPLSINCWPSPAGDGTIDVNIEYELENENQEFKEVLITIPLPSNGNPKVGQVDGQYEVNRQTRTFEWQLPIIDASNKQGSLEFNTPGDDISLFFPVLVSFVSEKLICDIDIKEVTNLDNGASVPFSKEKILTAEDYSVADYEKNEIEYF
ncbi:2748_t:CDS:10 [Ambispora leptoticha]|uniref:Coatomer subunit delta n=1 Tax=Ambispora leptoticha TaxID=144679 RepID=A0A9N9G0X5_9GLOM|nr:2748_t:CDS:10 [Ambispora leptoticha]